MKRKFSYSMKKMNRRLLAIGRPIRNYIAISTVASVLGALSHMGLMGFGALWLLAAAGFAAELQPINHTKAQLDFIQKDT